MSVEVTRENLKTKFNLSDEQLDEILKTGVETGLVQVAPPEKAELPGLEGVAPEGLDILKALKGEADLDQIMRFMIIDNWVKERFGKKLDDATIQEILKSTKETKKGDLDETIDRMMKYSLLESFMESRKTRSQPQPSVDIEKAITAVGDKMAEALRLHKIEEEKARAEERAELHKKEAEEAKLKLAEHIKTEEEEKKLEKKVKEKVEPIQLEVDKRIDQITQVLKGVPAEERGKYLLDLGETISEALNEEVKDRIIGSIREAFGEKEAVPVTTTPEGKIQVDWYKLGEKALKTLDNFIKRLPTQPPPKGEVKPMPLPQLPSAPPTQPPPPTQPTPSETKEETQPPPPPTPPSEKPTLARETTPPTPKPTEKPAEPEKPIITEKPKEETKETPKEKTEPAKPKSNPRKSRKITRTAHRSPETQRVNR